MRMWVTPLILRAAVLSADAVRAGCGAPPVTEINVLLAGDPRALAEKSRQIPWRSWIVHARTRGGLHQPGVAATSRASAPGIRGSA